MRQQTLQMDRIFPVVERSPCASAVAARLTLRQRIRSLRYLIVAPKLFIVCKESRRDSSPQPTVNNFAPPKRFTVNNVIFTRSIQVNTPGPEDESCCLNARRFTEDFRSGPGALMQRNSQSISPARQEGRDEPSIRTSVHQSPRVQSNEPIKL